ncbi:unnamed protein product [Calypogeia fissa]
MHPNKAAIILVGWYPCIIYPAQILTSHHITSTENHVYPISGQVIGRLSYTGYCTPIRVEGDGRRKRGGEVQRRSRQVERSIAREKGGGGGTVLLERVVLVAKSLCRRKSVKTTDEEEERKEEKKEKQQRRNSVCVVAIE